MSAHGLRHATRMAKAFPSLPTSVTLTYGYFGIVLVLAIVEPSNRLLVVRLPIDGATSSGAASGAGMHRDALRRGALRCIHHRAVTAVSLQQQASGTRVW